MSKGLEAWKYTRENYLQLKKEKYCNLEKEDLDSVLNSCNERCDIIEKELIALDIIRKKRVNARQIYHIDNDIQYNEKTRQYYDCVPLTQEEFYLLKEVLL